MQQLIGRQAIVLFIINKGFKDENPAGFQAFNDHWKQPPVQKPDINDKLVTILWYLPGIDVLTNFIYPLIVVLQLV